MKKICVVLHQFVMGGVEQVALSLFPELAKKYRITFLIKGEKHDLYLVSKLKEKGISVYYPPKKQKKILKRLWAEWVLQKIYKKRCHKHLRHSDLIIDYKFPSMFPEIFYISQIPKIAFFHGSFTLLSRLNPSNGLLSLYDCFICLTQNCQQNIIRKYPKLRDRISFIYNPLNKDEILNKAQKGDHPSHKYFIAIQRLAMDKDVATIIKAFNLFCQKRDGVYLYIVGDGSQKEVFQDLAQGNDKIIFTGKMNNPYPMIKSAQALLLSSKKNIGEGLPTVLLEAQALGTLAISSDVQSGPRDILMDGNAGILFPPHDEKALAQIMDDVISGKVDRQKLITTATNHLCRFEKEKILTQIDAIIQKNLNKNN